MLIEVGASAFPPAVRGSALPQRLEPDAINKKHARARHK
ncbi:hypothetical protein ETAE_2008 [Edwardsiella piscicida]|uniref:Uncharacterized protein n=2 Tax=Edwardsiella TaxID=635 RepID=A0A0H3DVE4_EDWTF|nr:hypothetical protein ETAE_2008 [Edwardsiella tarda EIB202]ADM41924.1 hypothetical protein ETAF_1816 [Edwardsiella tarda FL6-60]